MGQNYIYLDNASTTKVENKVLEEMLPYFVDNYGNANSLHNLGQISKKAITFARLTISKDFNCKPKNIFFTSCGSESNNWALKGFALANKQKGNHIIISSIEHDSILESAKFLENNGFIVSYVKPDINGHIFLVEIEKLITDKTILISVMAVNNETGCIQPINKISQLAHNYGIAYHVDFVQALSEFKPDIKNIKPDMLTISAHKIHGPKGIGILYIKDGTQICDLIDGGSQELGKRGGTLNTPLIIGFTKAIELNAEAREFKIKKFSQLNKYFLELLKEFNIDYHINGDYPKIENIINISFKDIDAEGLLHILNEKGIYISVGSACNSTSKHRSHVLSSMGIKKKIIDSSVRISFDENTSPEQLLIAVKTISETIKLIKKMKG